MVHVTVGQKLRSAAGEVVCGDAALILEEDGMVVVGVADGLGHGPKAAAASTAFCAYLRDHALESLDVLLGGAARACARTRGVAAVVLRIDTVRSRMEFAGVGNVACRAKSAKPITTLSTPGILGRGRVPRGLRVYTNPLASGDVLMVYTDGLVGVRLEDMHMEPQALADRMVDDYADGRDDATCVVLSVNGAARA
ncbi:serine/threonine-protein phosphatase [Planctomycetota bacterium]|nr:serine/threonine-protein phosphatase [Planctomycetota bacterium]